MTKAMRLCGGPRHGHTMSVRDTWEGGSFRVHFLKFVPRSSRAKFSLVVKTTTHVAVYKQDPRFPGTSDFVRIES